MLNTVMVLNQYLLTQISPGQTFNVFMCEMFLILKTISFTGYADYDAPFENTTNVVKALEGIGENLIKWLSDNQMKLNT